MSQMIMSFLVIILVTLSNYASSQISQPHFTIKAESGKAFDKSCLIGNFSIANGNIADCLEHCLANCSCQSFQICQNTQCQLCSSNKEDNSLLLHEKNGCIYAMYEMRHSTETFQKMKDQCSGMNCLLKYNCCQQSGLCPKNKICKPIYNITQPRKRFICECPEGYHGDNCDKPITSCRGYSTGSRESGKYKILGSEKSMYEVYCHFDISGTWTLVQSYSFEMYKSNDRFREALSENKTVNEDEVKWSEYRLSKNRMESIENDSLRLAFTCDYEKRDGGNNDLDSVVIRLGKKSRKPIDVFKLNERKMLSPVHCKVRKVWIKNCSISLYQNKQHEETAALHIAIDDTGSCNFKLPFNSSECNDWKKFNYFGNYNYNEHKCFDMGHDCVKHDNSTTQLWFGN